MLFNNAPAGSANPGINSKNAHLAPPD